MQGIQGSDNKLNSQRKRDISIDRYDTSSDEEDHRREEEEIKRIIMKSRIKAASKTKPVNSEVLQHDITMSSRVRQDSFASPSSVIPSKAKNLKGFFPTAANSLGSVDRKDLSQELERTLDQRPKKSKFNQKSNDIRALLEMDVNYSYDEKEVQNMLTGVTEPSTTKLPEIRNPAKNNDFYKESFHNLLNLYARSTTTNPTALFTEKTYLSNRALAAFDLGEMGKKSSKSPLQISFTATEGDGEDQESSDKKKIKNIIPQLISAILANAWEPLDKKDPYEVPRLKTLDWPAIMKKNGSKKLHMLIIDPIEFAIEDCKDIDAENPQDIKDKINEAIREINPTTNEAKQILVYYYDEATNEKRLIFTKFFFFLKNHKFYNKNFKNEKDVIMYYVMILALLELRANYETNPFKPEKIEASKKKAMNLVKAAEGFPAFVCDWLVNKVQPIMVVEKVYVNLNVGGKADSNFTFSVHEYLAYTFPSIGRILHGQKMLSGSKSVGHGNMGIRSSPAQPMGYNMPDKPKPKPKEVGAISIPKNPLDTTTRDLKTTQRNTNRSTDLAKKKLELSVSVVDLATKDRREDATSHDPMNRILPQSVLASLASPASSNQNDFHGFNFGKDRENALNSKWPTKLDPIGQTNPARRPKKVLTSHIPAEAKTDPKVYLTKQRMNTSYGQLLKHRFAKRNVWSQKL